MSWINLSALWKIVVYGLIAVAGLPALFAVGLRALAWPGGARVQTAGAGAGAGVGAGPAADDDQIYRGNVLGLIIAVIIALAILAALGWCIYEVYQIGHPAAAKK
jgi:hypothetical protein